MTPELIERLSDPLSDHRGVLLIHDTMLRQLAPEITLDSINTQGQLRDAGVFARLRERLLMPESYTIVAIVARDFGQEWAILIESPELPDAHEMNWEDIEYPRVDPIYCQTFNEETHLYEPHLVVIKVHAHRTVQVKGGLDWLVKATVEPAEKTYNMCRKEDAGQEKPFKEIIFDPHKRPWPSGIMSWDSAGYQPRDMSWGYIETLHGRVHVLAGDRILIGPDGAKDVVKDESKG